MKRKAEAKEVAKEPAKKPKHGSTAAKILAQTYRVSPEAKKLFLGDSTDERDLVQVLEQGVERLQQVNKTRDGWRNIVDKHDKDNLCSAHDIFIIRQRCSILCLAYMNALEEMNSARWVEDCCAQACKDNNKMGIEAAATNERNAAGWNILLRGNREHFPLPNPKIHKQKKPLPDLLEYFQEEITLPWLEYCIENLADLTVELARNELITKIIPDVNAQKQSDVNGVDEGGSTGHNDEEDEDENDSRIHDSRLQIYTDFPISISTTWRWLRRLGFSYDFRKKSFFVDEHERRNVVFRRNEFCIMYLSNPEQRTHRWIQVTKQAVEKWKADKSKLSRWARAYICAYYSLHESKCKGDDTPTLTLPLTERLIKAFKTHRAAIDFDVGFVNGFVQVLQGVIANN